MPGTEALADEQQQVDGGDHSLLDALAAAMVIPNPSGNPLIDAINAGAVIRTASEAGRLRAKRAAPVPVLARRTTGLARPRERRPSRRRRAVARAGPDDPGGDGESDLDPRRRGAAP